MPCVIRVPVNIEECQGDIRRYRRLRDDAALRELRPHDEARHPQRRVPNGFFRNVSAAVAVLPVVSLLNTLVADEYDRVRALSESTVEVVQHHTDTVVNRTHHLLTCLPLHADGGVLTVGRALVRRAASGINIVPSVCLRGV